MTRFKHSGAVRRRAAATGKTLQVPLSEGDWEFYIAIARREGLSPPELTRAALRELELLPALEPEGIAR